MSSLRKRGSRGRRALPLRILPGPSSRGRENFNRRVVAHGVPAFAGTTTGFRRIAEGSRLRGLMSPAVEQGFSGPQALRSQQRKNFLTFPKFYAILTPPIAPVGDLVWRSGEQRIARPTYRCRGSTPTARMLRFRPPARDRHSFEVLRARRLDATLFGNRISFRRRRRLPTVSENAEGGAAKRRPPCRRRPGTTSPGLGATARTEMCA